METKQWWKSKGVMGSVAVLVCLIGSQCCGGNWDSEQVTTQLMDIGIAASSLIALWGRITANTKVGK